MMVAVRWLPRAAPVRQQVMLVIGGTASRAGWLAIGKIDMALVEVRHLRWDYLRLGARDASGVDSAPPVR